MKNRDYGETCIVCDQQKEKGLHLYSQFICKDCETDIIKTDTDDQKYQYYVEKMRKVTQQQILS
jgi:hypothetical protein